MLYKKDKVCTISVGVRGAEKTKELRSQNNKFSFQQFENMIRMINVRIFLICKDKDDCQATNR